MSSEESPAIESATDSTAATSTESEVGYSHAVWFGGLLVAAVVALLMHVKTPIRSEIPEEYIGVDMYSPADVQRKADIAVNEAKWKNTFYKLGLVGLCLGAIPALAGGWKRNAVPIIVLGVVGGLAAGCLSAYLGMTLRNLANDKNGILLGGDPMVTDMLLFTITNLLLAVPIGAAFLLSGADQAGQKLLAVLIGAAAAGAIIPLAGIMLPAAATNVFPVQDIGLTAIWLIVTVLCIGGITPLVGKRS